MFNRTSFCAAVLGVLLGSPAQAQPHYSITEVTGKPLRVWNAYNIGPKGEVVGRSYDLNVDPPLSVGFVWKNGVMTLLGGPNGETMTEARCMDTNGVVYGGSIDRRFPLNLLKMNPLRWVNQIPIPYTNNADINSSTLFSCSPTTGVASGWAKPFEPGTLGWRGEFGYDNEFDFGSSDPVRAFRWTPSAGGGTGAVLTKWTGSHDDNAFSINDAGQAAVQLGAFESGGPAIYDPRFGLTRLPTLGVGEPGGFCVAINQSGQIVGWSQASSANGGMEHPVRWEQGQITDLGLLPTFVEGQAVDINDTGVIVGGLAKTSFPFGIRSNAGFVYVGSMMYDLNTLIPTGTGLTVVEAIAINYAGQILVSLSPFGDTNQRYAVLTPIP